MKFNKILELVANQLLILMASTTFYGAISILINQNISGLFLIFGIITAMIYSFFVLSKNDLASKSKHLNIIYVNFLFLLIVIIGLLISGKYYDISHDGQMYH